MTDQADPKTGFYDISRRPDIAIPVFGLVMALYWIISNWGSSLHPDMTEAYIWGREFSASYWKHPPFWAWVSALWFSIMPHTTATFAMLSAVNTAVGAWGVWQLTGLFSSGHKRAAATALYLLTPFPTLFAYKYNANSIFLSVWPWTVYAFVVAYRSRQTGPSILFGVMLAMSYLCKEFALILWASLALAALSGSNRKQYFGSLSPYLSIMTAGILLTPYAVWMKDHFNQPLGYIEQHSELGLALTFYNIQKVISGTVLSLAAPILVIGYVARSKLRQTGPMFANHLKHDSYRMITLVTFLPLIMMLLIGSAIESKLDVWMLLGAWGLFPLWLIETWQAQPIEMLARLANRLVIALLVLLLLSAPLIAIYRIYFENYSSTQRLGQDQLAFAEPRQELAEYSASLWRKVSDRPFRFAAGSEPYADSIAFYGPTSVSSLMMLDFSRATWAKPEDVKRAGLLIACVETDHSCMIEAEKWATPQSIRITVTLSHHILSRDMPAETFAIYVVPPATASP